MSESLLYAAAISPYSQRVIMQIALKKLPIEIEEPPGGLGSEAYRAINPMAKVPALLYAGEVLPESAVIAEFLEDIFPDQPLRPADAWQRAQMNVVIRVADTYVMDAMLPLFSQLDPSSRDDALISATLAAVADGLDRLDVLLEPSPFAAGPDVTLADLALVPILKFCQVFLPAFGGEDPFPGRNAISQYWATAQGEPTLAHCLAEMQAAIESTLGHG